jgi:NADPH-dependent curcumin reductase CurA
MEEAVTDRMKQRIVLAKRPTGAPTLEDFRLEEVPSLPPAEGEVQLETLYLSLDPYMRGRMSAGPSYAAPVAIDATMEGGAVSRVTLSRDPRFQAGDLVLGSTGWQSHATVPADGLVRLDPAMARPSLALGVLGMPGLTAYMGLLDIGKPKPGETVVVAAATGAVGSVVGQIARLQGCRVVGIAGGPEKCRYAVEELGFDACLDHHDPDLASKLNSACPQGIDVYFENVGGAVFETVLPLLNTCARVPVCGLISQYNATDLPAGPDRTPLLMRTLLTKRIRMQGFIVFQDYGNRVGEFQEAMQDWLRAGDIQVREDVVEGLANAPEAFLGLLQGRNFGKLIIHVANNKTNQPE